MKHMFAACLAGALTMAAFTAAAEAPRVFFIEPKDGAVVASPFTVRMGVEGLALKPAGDAAPDSGHHHLIIDAGPVPKGETIGKSETMLHFGKAQAETEISLPPGRHTLTLQFGDGAHVSWGPALSATIHVEVKP